MAGEIVFIGGASGVGKTSVALEVHAKLSAAEVSHCVVDGDYLDMAHPAPWHHNLAERNLTALWANYRALGYSRMVYANTASVLPSVMESLVEAMGGDVEAVAILLTCTTETARRRLRERERGSELARHVESSSQMAVTLEANCPSGVHRVSTENRSVHSVAADVIRLTGWLSRQPQEDPVSPSDRLRRGGARSVHVAPADVEAKLALDKGPCDNSRTHIFNLTAGAETPRFSKTAARLLASGWRLSGIFRATSGNALSISTGLDRSLNGVVPATQRVNAVLDNPYGDKTLNNWFNPAAFAQPAIGATGTSGRNAYLGPGSRTLDLSLVRSFSLQNMHRIEARVEAFNAFNWLRWGDPITVFSDANFGRILTSADPRILQFAVKYQF